jgi:endonuclease/exonuclease/phosphatase family metal-dependent hydrolase
VGSWNIEWLGSSKRQQPIDMDTIEDIARNIAEVWSIDIITLQEINTDMNGDYRGESYSLLPWQRLQNALKKRGYQTAAGRSGYAQHVVLAWRKPVIALEAPRDISIPDQYIINEHCRSSHLRKPFGGLFQAGQFDFWMIGLHLKANTGPAVCTSAVRSAQITALSKSLKPLSARDADVILAGDFNAGSQHNSLKELKQTGFVALTDKNLRNLGSNRFSYHSKNSKKANSGSLFDHIMIRPAFTQESTPASTAIFTPKDAHLFANTYSDHLPLWSDFSTKTDDD